MSVFFCPRNRLIISSAFIPQIKCRIVLTKCRIVLTNSRIILTNSRIIFRKCRIIFTTISVVSCTTISALSTPCFFSHAKAQRPQRLSIITTTTSRTFAALREAKVSEYISCMQRCKVSQRLSFITTTTSRNFAALRETKSLRIFFLHAKAQSLAKIILYYHHNFAHLCGFA